MNGTKNKIFFSIFSKQLEDLRDLEKVDKKG